MDMALRDELLKQEHVDYIPYLFHKVVDFLDLKILVGLAWSGIVFFFDGGQTQALLALFFLVLADWIFGFAAAKKTGVPITSAKCFRTPVKLAIYFALVACARISEYALPGALGFLDETMVAGLVLTELISIFENSGRLGFVVPQRLLNQVREWKDGDLSTKK